MTPFWCWTGKRNEAGLEGSIGADDKAQKRDLRDLIKFKYVINTIARLKYKEGAYTGMQERTRWDTMDSFEISRLI